jgi:prepilin-type N-terminal cleavage/methylation domain-containing protein
MPKHYSKTGFTLTELMIALGLVGILASIALPALLNAPQQGLVSARAKRGQATVASAYTQFVNDRGRSSTLRLNDFVDNINHTGEVTTGLMDAPPSGTAISFDCADATIACYRLQDDSVLVYDTTQPFGGTTNWHAISYFIDPDGRYEGSVTTNTTSISKSTQFLLYYDGKTRTAGRALTGSLINGTAAGLTVTDPTYYWATDS